MMDGYAIKMEQVCSYYVLQEDFWKGDLKEFCGITTHQHLNRDIKALKGPIKRIIIYALYLTDGHNTKNPESIFLSNLFIFSF